jgi:uncharacterized protein (DUF2141 family)
MPGPALSIRIPFSRIQEHPMRFPRLARSARIGLLSLSLLLPLTVPAQEGAPEPEDAVSSAELFDIIVRVVDGEPATGTLEISLFNSAEFFLQNPYLQTSGPINEDGSYNARFGKVPPGEYAVVVVHDENGNGELDTGFLGFGGESYAFSNDVKPLFGRPSFDEVKFAVSGHTQIQIKLN